MTIRLRLISGEDEEFFRDIEICGEATFLDLHNFIHKLLNFDEGQMASFFITDEEWQKNEEITLVDMAMDESIQTNIMSEITIKQFINHQKQKLLYVFDFFNERNLFIEAYEITNELCTEPKCIEMRGEAPQQLDLSILLGESDDNKELTADDYLGDNFDDNLGDDFNDDSMISYTDDLEDL